MEITAAQLLAFMPTAKGRVELYAEPLNAAMAAAQINTPVRAAMFLAQVAHESTELLNTSENLNYGASALRLVFHHQFPTDEIAQEYARQPERIANRAYANRLGNGDEASGDGWKHRGMGLIGLTGLDLHRRFSLAYFGDARLVDDPSFLMTPKGACESAAWFWTKEMNLNGIADAAEQGAFLLACERVNGINPMTGRPNGWASRLAYWQKAKTALGVPA